MTQHLAFVFGYTNLIANGVIILMILLNIIVYKLQQLQEAKFSEQTNNYSLSLPQVCRRFSLAEIQRATSNFHDDLVIGQGGFGKVFKGILDFGASTVAIKRLNSMSKQGSTEFRTEIEMLSKFRHSHLVSLVGYCNDCYEMILVYEYMPCGTLADHLYKHKKVRKGDNSLPPLSWEQRLKICIGAARGLEYLHTGTSIQHRVIHRDVKSTNILLDENLAARISDFGLSKIGPANQASTYVSTHIKGSFGYMDPYYFSTRRLTRKSDVYGFGVVLFEVLCGRAAVDLSLDEEQMGLAGWAQHCFKEGLLDQIIDPCMKGEILPNSLMAFVKVAIQCLRSSPKQRPTMAEVVVSIESALALQEVGTNYSLAEWSISNHNQENKNSSTEEGVVNGANGGHNDEQSPARMTFTKKFILFLSVTARVFSVHSDAKPTRNSKSNNNKSNNSVSLVKDEGIVQARQEVMANLKMFTLAELRRATSNFGPRMRLDEGWFGRVFRGWVHKKTYAPSTYGVGMAIAVKRLSPKRSQGHRNWQSEIKLLGEYSHPNLVKLLGYCQEDEECFLVYEHMEKGSLDTHLFKSAEPLPWDVRLKILIGAARCLAFFHTVENQVIHGNFQTSNILLDGEFNAKLSGCGLAEYSPVNGDRHISTDIMGTYGYGAPEYVFLGHLGVKSDVYGFGVVLLELLTGMRAYDRKLVDWAKPFLAGKREVKRILDPSLDHDFPNGEMLSIVTSLILQCVRRKPRKRPSMAQVLETLEKIKALSWDNLYIEQ